jgi:O-antigen/teichoic acid export membrane protein
MVLAATNRQGSLVWILLSNALLNVLLTVILVRPLGIRGVAIAAVGADLMIAAWLVPWRVSRALGFSFLQYSRRMLGTLLFTLILPCCLAGSLWWVLPASTLRDLLAPAFGVVVSAGVMFVLLSGEEHVIVREVIKRIGVAFSRAGHSITAGAINR